MRTFGINRHTLVILLACMALPFVAYAQVPAGAGVVHSEMMPLASTRALILDITGATSRMVAVGERGQVLVSEDGSDWRQVEDVPTRTTLTAVSAVGDAVWAVGHDGTIIASSDGGLSWQLQRQDIMDTSADAVFDPRQGVPLLDVLMLSESHGFAVGAYSQLLRTDDGGESWQFIATEAALAGDDVASDDDALDDGDPSDDDGDDSWTFSDEDLEMDMLDEPHFNAITQTGSGALLIVGERGAAYRSRDDGNHWERLQLPYQGSMFGVLGYDGDHVLAFGMRGNVLESRDLGDSWEFVDTGTELSLEGGTVLGNGGFVLVGANGIVVVRDSANAATARHVFVNRNNETPVLAAVSSGPGRALILSGEKGMDNYTPGN